MVTIGEPDALRDRLYVLETAIEDIECAQPSYSAAKVAARWRCTRLTDMEPSPTAAATRFVEPVRTSPAAKTPGRLVVSGG